MCSTLVVEVVWRMVWGEKLVDIVVGVGLEVCEV